MRSVFYDFDPKTSLFEHHLTKESISSEVGYILSISEMLEVLEHKKPKFFLVEANEADIATARKLSTWVTGHILPQIARLGVRKMAIVDPTLAFIPLRNTTSNVFPWLTVATFTTNDQAREWLLNPTSNF